VSSVGELMVKVNGLESKELNKIIKAITEQVEKNLLSRLKVSDDKEEWDFEEISTPTVAATPRNVDGLLSFQEMTLSKERTKQQRNSPLWRKSCAHWINHFKSLDQPVTIWYSKIDRPQAWTCYPREVKSERVEITKVLGNIEERTFVFNLIYGLDLPRGKERGLAKKQMNKIWDIVQKDSAEFTRFKKSVIESTANSVNPTELVATDDNIGTQYEKQLEYEFNLSGYHVNLHGVKKNLQDEGVDHILIKNGKTSLVQAKAYSRNNTIDKNALDIIYNNMLDFYGKHQNNSALILGPKDLFVLAVPKIEVLTTEARTHAEHVGLHVAEVPLREDWPKYKCTLSGKNKIFYGPKDSHYSKVEMLADKRRFWADSIEEAKGKGYLAPKAGAK